MEVITPIDQNNNFVLYGEFGIYVNESQVLGRTFDLASIKKNCFTPNCSLESPWYEGEIIV